MGAQRQMLAEGLIDGIIVTYAELMFMDARKVAQIQDSFHRQLQQAGLDVW